MSPAPGSAGRRRIALLVLLVLVAGILPLRALWGIRGDTVAELGVVQGELTANRARLQQARQADNQREDYLDTLETLERALPAGADLPGILDDLSAAAASTGVVIVSVDPSVPAADGEAGAAPTTIPAEPQEAAAGNPEPAEAAVILATTLTGTVEGVIAFMEVLRDQPRLYIPEATEYAWTSIDAGAFVTTTMRIYAFTWDSTYESDPGAGGS